MKELKEYVKALEDRPLTFEDEDLFVDREIELKKMAELDYYFEGKIIGVCGQRGIGKTTLFNFSRFPGKNKLIIKIIDRENKLSIISNIIGEIITYSKTKGYNEIEKMGKKLFTKIHVSKKEAVGISYIIEYKQTKEEKISLFNFLKSFKKFMDLLSKKERLVIVLDEIDKQKVDEILLLVDAIKDAFVSNSITLFVALPYEFYENFISSKTSSTETHNLENVFSYMFLLEPFSDDDVKRIISRRFPLSLIEEEALNKIVEFADGNPRKAITTLKEAGIIAEGKIRLSDVKGVISRYIRTWIKSTKLTQNELNVFRLIEDGRVADITQGVSKKLRKSRSVVYKYLKKFEEAGLLNLEGKNAELSRMGRLVKEVI